MLPELAFLVPLVEEVDGVRLMEAPDELTVPTLCKADEMVLETLSHSERVSEDGVDS